MLGYLLIKNIALIDELEIEFSEGLNCLTGETGAGKSVVVDSIGFMLGARSNRELIRSGADSCFVSGTFYGEEKNTDEKLIALGIEPESDGTVIISRELNTAGRNICRINGRTVTLSNLREISELLIDIHGQHDNTTLMSPENHLGFVDAFGDVFTTEAFEKYAVCYREYAELKEKIQRNNLSPEEREKRITELKERIREIEGADVKKGELERLIERQKILESGEDIAESITAAVNAVEGDGYEVQGALSEISEGASALEKIADISENYGEIASRMNDIKYNLEDLLHDLRNAFDEANFSPEELRETENRIDAIEDLKRKYGDDLEASLEEAQKALYDMEDGAEEAGQLARRFDAIKKELALDGEAVTRVRKGITDILSREICEELAELEMAGAVFTAEIKETESFGQTGMNTAEFLVSTNKGEPVKPVAKIASGGELSRIMLAIKSILADSDSIPTLIFDEIDVGISGRTADTVGTKLKKISGSHQVICVTHSTQIAVKANNNILLLKEESPDGRTLIRAKTLDYDGKVREIARLLDGNPNSEMAVKHAKQLIEENK